MRQPPFAHFFRTLLLTGLVLGAARELKAQSPTPVVAAPEDKATLEAKREALIKSLHYQTGSVSLRGGLAKLDVPGTFRYLGPDDAEKVLHNLWGNPPQESTLGLLIPANMRPDAAESWAVVIEYEEEGYIKDDEADKIDYSDLLKKMKDGSREMNKKRVEQGYPSMELVGWATAPRYDKAAKKMYWAKDLKVDGNDEDTLNYNIRILGRRGVLILNAVASMSQLAQIEQASPEILKMVEFSEGHRYADFNPKTDKVAAYGLAALVAGGVAAKLGLFKVLIGALLAAKKVVIIAVIAAAAWVKKLFSSGREDRT